MWAGLFREAFSGCGSIEVKRDNSQALHMDLCLDMLNNSCLKQYIDLYWNPTEKVILESPQLPNPNIIFSTPHLLSPRDSAQQNKNGINL